MKTASEYEAMAEECFRWAQQLRSALDRGHDPKQYNREGQDIIAVNILLSCRSC